MIGWEAYGVTSRDAPGPLQCFGRHFLTKNAKLAARKARFQAISEGLSPHLAL